MIEVPENASTPLLLFFGALIFWYVAASAQEKWKQEQERQREAKDRQKAAQAAREEEERRNRENESRRAQAIAQENEVRRTIVVDAIQRHRVTLARKRRQLVRIDDYGIEHTESWMNEQRYFLDNVLNRVVPEPAELTYHSSLWHPQQDPEWVFQEIDSVVETTELPTDSDEACVEGMSPVEFENFCAHQLQRAGWTTRVTPQSGDQGIDILCEGQGQRLVVQAKRYAGAVGNSAVQQIIAGRELERADYGAVVSTGVYTQAARQLAKATRVYLLHPEDLPGFAPPLKWIG